MYQQAPHFSPKAHLLRHCHSPSCLVILGTWRYHYIAFTTSVAFSPTDTLPLIRRAKLLMLLQATVSLVTITGIAGSAINIPAGGR
jgi:hypothetical protein